MLGHAKTLLAAKEAISDAVIPGRISLEYMLILPPAWIAGSGMAAEEVGMFGKHRSVCVANAAQGCALRRSAPSGELTRPPCVPHVPLFVIRWDHQHGLGMDRLDRGDHIDAAESRFYTDDFRASFRNKDKDNQLGPYSSPPSEPHYNSFVGAVFPRSIANSR